MNAELATKLRIEKDSEVWIWPEGADPGDLTAGGARRVADPGSAAVAVAFVDAPAEVDEVMTAHRDALAELKAVWFVYAKGGASVVTRDTLWTQVAGYGWKAVSNVWFSDVLSAVRVRPLKPGEPPAA